MSYGKLSTPWSLSGESDIYHLIKEAEQRFFRLFIKRERRPYYNGKFIFFDTSNVFKEHTLPFPERFAHICSIEDKQEYTIYPCNNDNSYALCHNKCTLQRALQDFQQINRSECVYRASRLLWIPEIINLANNEDESVYTWTKQERGNRGNIIKKHYIRYVKDTVDYLVIFKEEWVAGELKFYKFISAFPVFLKGHKKQYDRDFKKFGIRRNQPENTFE